MKYTVKQMMPLGFRLFPVAASDTREALDVVRTMVARGAIAVEIIDANGLHYDLIDLEREFDEEA